MQKIKGKRKEKNPTELKLYRMSAAYSIQVMKIVLMKQAIGILEIHQPWGWVKQNLNASGEMSRWRIIGVDPFALLLWMKRMKSSQRMLASQPVRKIQPKLHLRLILLPRNTNASASKFRGPKNKRKK